MTLVTCSQNNVFSTPTKPLGNGLCIPKPHIGSIEIVYCKKRWTYALPTRFIICTMEFQQVFFINSVRESSDPALPKFSQAHKLSLLGCRLRRMDASSISCSRLGIGSLRASRLKMISCFLNFQLCCTN